MTTKNIIQPSRPCACGQRRGFWSYRLRRFICIVCLERKLQKKNIEHRVVFAA